MSNLQTSEPNTSQIAVQKHKLSHLSEEWWCILITGLLPVIAGTFSIAYPLFTSVGVVILIGVIQIICGVTTVISAFWAGNWNAFFVHILGGLVYFVAGFMITEMPVESLALFTLILAGLFIVSGGCRICHGIGRQVPAVGLGLGQWYRDPHAWVDYFPSISVPAKRRKWCPLDDRPICRSVSALQRMDLDYALLHH